MEPRSASNQPENFWREVSLEEVEKEVERWRRSATLRARVLGLDAALDIILVLAGSRSKLEERFDILSILEDDYDYDW